MKQYTLSAKTADLLRFHKKVVPENIEYAPMQDIEKYNRSDIKNKQAFKRLYKPCTKNISLETYIIPINNGSATGYLFKKTNNTTSLSPLIIYFHEGGYTLGNMECCNAICSNICNLTGSTVLAVDYRLAPMYKFPIPVNDCYSAFVWAYQGARYWKTDTSKIFLMGSCTGATLAIAVSRIARDKKDYKIAGLILEDPLTDCRLRTQSLETHKDNPILSKKTLTFFIQNYQREPKDILDPLFSPLLGLDQSRLPPALIFSSELSPLYDDAHLFATALQLADTPAKVLEIKNKPHCFLKYPDSDRYSDQIAAINSFLEGKPVMNIELLTKRERKIIAKTKPPIVVQ